VFVFLLLLVLWPLVEIAVFLQVVQWIGVLDTLVAMLVISLGGAWLVKRQGVGTFARMRTELDKGRVPTGPMTDGGLLALAGFLLLVPGFVTDAFGLLLLLPPVRAGVRLWLGRRVTARERGRVRRRPDVGYIDLEDPGPGPPPRRNDPPELLP
jgi:UPF0716 protein FxsA